MKRLILLSLSTFLVLGVFAQKKTVELSKQKIGELDCTYSKVIDLENADTTYYVYIGFQNAKYKSVSDFKSIMFRENEVLAEFIKDLKLAQPELGNKTNLDFNRKDYNLNVYDFSKNLSIGESSKKGTGYCYVSKKDVEKLLGYLESIKFGNSNN